MFSGLKEAIGATAAIVVLVIVGMLAVAGLTVAGVEIHAAISKTTGDAKVKSDTNNGTNQEVSSAIFAQLTTQITGDQAQMESYVQAGVPMTSILLVQSDCLDAVKQYNADATTDTTEPNLPAGDPVSYNPIATCVIPTK